MREHPHHRTGQDTGPGLGSSRQGPSGGIGRGTRERTCPQGYPDEIRRQVDANAALTAEVLEQRYPGLVRVVTGR
jgi:hypothetical protein